MFNRLISNLAFSPSSIDQVSFYAKRLKQEKSIRRIGFILIVFSMMLQIFAAMVPPEKSMAASGNDVISGGVTSVKQLKAKYNAHPDVKALYDRFGLNETSLNGTVKNTSFDFKQQGSDGTRTVGRVNFASTNDNYLGNLGGSNFYSRSASEWLGSEPAYFFGKHKGTDGNYYYLWVLKNCGNIAYRKADTPKPKTKPAPAPATTKTTTKAPPPVKTQTVQTQTQTQSTTVIIQQAPSKPEKPLLTPVCPNNPKLKPDDILCKCVDNPSITADNPDCTTPGWSKTAQNLTQKLTPAQTTSTAARANDVIEYTLTTSNSNVISKKGVTIQDYIGDVLDYATLDTAFLEAQGGTYIPDSKTIRWSNQTLPAKGKVTNSFRVVVKPVIPSTNRPNATSTDFDCKMQNGYGNEVIIPVSCPPIKEVESLPNTGPGTTIAVGFTVSAISGYFFMRSRLLAKEVGIIKRTYQSTGF